MGLKIAFMGTPEFSIPTLGALIDEGYEICAVYTQPPRPAGRGNKRTPSPIEKFSLNKGLKIYSPISLREEGEKTFFKNLKLDVAIVVAYGLILPREILEAPKLGCLNVHASLLPRWRGAAPIQRAIMAGDTKTGITIMQMDEGLDTGDILSIEETKITKSNTTQTLHDSLADIGRRLLVKTLNQLAANSSNRIPQSKEGVTYAQKVEKSEAKINWADNAKNIDLKVRGLCPFPGAWFSFKGERIKIIKGEILEGSGKPGLIMDNGLTIGCGEGLFRVLRAQKSGKSQMNTDDFLRGFPINQDDQLDLTQ